MNGEKQNNWDIRNRSFKYALRAIKLYQCLQEGKNGAGWIIAKQYLRSATSVGSNVQEAQSGESRSDFIHKYSIAQNYTLLEIYNKQQQQRMYFIL